MFSDVFDLFSDAILQVFTWQGLLWDEIGVYVSWLLGFVGFCFFRFIVYRFIGDMSSDKADVYRSAKAKWGK